MKWKTLAIVLLAWLMAGFILALVWLASLYGFSALLLLALPLFMFLTYGRASGAL